MMKKIHHFFLFTLVIISSFLILLLNDQKQVQTFNFIDFKPIHRVITLPSHDSTWYIAEKKLIFDKLANEAQVDLFVTFHETKQQVRKFIMSGNSSYAVCQFLSVTTNCEDLPYKTYGTDQNIQDLFHNDRYSYDTILNTAQDTSIYWTGRFTIFYEHDSQFENFLNTLSEELSIPKDSIRISNNINWDSHRQLVYFLPYAILLLLIICILGVIQDVRDKTREIGIYHLLGFTNTKIIQKMVSKNIILIAATSIIIQLILLFVPFVNISIRTSLFLKDLLIIVSMSLVHISILRKISNQVSLSDILKKRKVAESLGMFVTFIQCCLCIFVSIIILINSEYISETNRTMSKQKEINYLLDYGVIGSFNSKFLLNNKLDSITSLYTTVKNHAILKNKYLYSNFDLYSVLSPEATVQSGYNYDNMYAIVSPNYFVIEQIKVVDKANKNFVLPTDVYKDIFIFPRDYNKDSSVVLDEYFNSHKTNYASKELFQPIILYYDNQLVNTYNIDYPQIESPVFVLLRDDNTVNYLEHSSGISTVGIGIYTSLKFRTDGDSTAITDILSKIFELSMTPFQATNFITYSGYLNDIIQRNISAILVSLYLIGLISLVYLFVKIHFISLFMISNAREIYIRNYLGHQNSKIYKSIFELSFITLAIAVIVSLFINYFFQIGDWTIFIGLCTLFLIFDSGILMLVIYFMNKKKLSIAIKGG